MDDCRTWESVAALTLSTPLTYVKGIGPQLGKLFSSGGFQTVSDWLWNLPKTYEDRRELPLLAELTQNQTATIVVIVRSVRTTETRNKKSMIEATIRDGSREVVAIWFNQGFLYPKLLTNSEWILKGKLVQNPYSNHHQFIVQESEIRDRNSPYQLGKILPVYGSSLKLGQAKLREITNTLLSVEITDHYPDEFIAKLGILSLKNAIHELHFPTVNTEFKRARFRLIFDEFLIFYLHQHINKLSRESESHSQPLTPGNYFTQWRHELPYPLTPGQATAIDTVIHDLNQPKTMNRMIQGDVGCGKTDVAMAAMVIAMDNHKSAALMAPTEILAVQHYYKLKTRLPALEDKIFLLKGQQNQKTRKLTLDALQSGPAIVVGTHALLQNYVDIVDLGVVIIDEQHRFGVIQRLILKEKGDAPHCLYMTATPIPRSLLLTVFGDLDKTIISDLPPGRAEIRTVVVTSDHMQSVKKYCDQELAKGHQIFIVYPLIEDSETQDLASATAGFDAVSTAFPTAKVGLIHGKMPNKIKQDIMTQFRKKTIHILVSTTVIEVGIDIPNATIMIIQNADRFGLSALHQLRGRIGRGSLPGTCFLVSNSKGKTARKRLSALCKTRNGFELAQVDMAIRGPGDMLGTRQSGLPEFHVADLVKDEAILVYARDVATELLKQNQITTDTKWKKLFEKIKNTPNPIIANPLN